MNTRRRTRAACAACTLPLLAIVASGCQSRELAPIEPCPVSGEVRELEPTSATKVDVLFVVDNSGSMSEEQESLAREFPRLVNALATGDLDGDGAPDFPPVPDLHIGVVSTDMGTGPVAIEGVCPGGLGDDGVLRTRSTAEGCVDTYPSFLELESPVLGEPDPATVEEFVADFSCLARLGTGGCGFEQQLEAPLKALTPQGSTALTFAEGTGHGDGANAGFLRDDSLLAVIVVTDEEDCSAVDPGIYDASESRFSGERNVRCYREENHHALHPVSRYVEGLLDLRDPELLVLGAIAGVPPALVEHAERIDYDGILAHPDMQYRDTGDDGFPVESCVAPDGRGEAYPPRRIVEVARELEARGGHAVVQSICQRSFAGAVSRILEKIGGQLDGLCLARPLHPDAEGMVSCHVIETLTESSDVRACDELPGRVVALDPSTGEPRRDGRDPECRVIQLPAPGPGEPAPTAPGWFYGEGGSTSCPQRVRYTQGAEPVPGVRVQLECLQSVVASGAEGELALGSPCAPVAASDECAASPTLGGALRCDGVTRTCQLPCQTDADCAGRGLGAFACDTGGVFPFERPMCVNSTCGSRLLDG